MEQEILALIVELHGKLVDVKPSREISLALTKLDECEMWIEKAFNLW